MMSGTTRSAICGASGATGTSFRKAARWEANDQNEIEKPRNCETLTMKLSDVPFAEKKFMTVNGQRVAYIDEGEGDAIVFSHDNPTSSYIWRNIMPASRGLGRLIACDLVGQGDPDNLPNSGPGEYDYFEQRSFMHALWDQLDLGDNVIFVVHDWGSALAFNYASKHADRVQGVAYMESIVTPFEWRGFSELLRPAFEAMRSPAGDAMVMQENFFAEQVLFASVARPLSDAVKAEHRRPFMNPGEDRRPTLSWPRQIPIAGEPADVVDAVKSYSQWLATSPVPKLYFHATPGVVDSSPNQVAFCRTFSNQEEIRVEGAHYIPEESPEVVAPGVAAFVRGLRGIA
ncbi:haloalkane dehalogenase [Rhizobium lusitanum]|jgi:haloalkane dehalogenase|uniref:Haloalkane dehalogenase n=2 Tax=Rhizobium/Agrobacterium group TaxID=227290 RepID=A0A1C3XC91_9HYPH|nr:haloalkane dehalogenase [Rhizobium lusitanum]